MSFPTRALNWMVGNLAPNSTEPPTGKKLAGWAPGESPYSDHFNWMFNNISKWIAEFSLRSEYKWIVGAPGYGDFTSLAECIASSNVYGGHSVLVIKTDDLTTALTIDKGLDITFLNCGLNGKSGDPAVKINITATSVKIRGGSFLDFNSTIFSFNAGGGNCVISDVRVNKFLAFDDSLVPANEKPSISSVVLLQPT